MKKIIVSILLLLPLGLVAQEMKIALVNTQDIINVMPEVGVMETEMLAMRQQYQKEAQIMEDEYNRKFADFTAQNDSLTDNIRKLRIQEIESIRDRLQNFVPMAQETIEAKQNELLAPIYDKLQKAIDSVGEEQGYMCIMNPQAFLYKGKGLIDATEQVKAKLGLK